MDAWVVWLVVAAALGALELTSLTLVFGFAAGAALIAGLIALAGAPVWLQLVLFSAVLLVLLAFVRPLALRHRLVPPTLRSGVDALVGQSAVALTTVEEASGTVRLAGEVWTARPAEHEPIAIGTKVRVVAIQGATALVTPELGTLPTAETRES